MALDSDLFDAHMADTSVLTQLLKGHLWLEHAIGRSLEIGLRHPERVKIERMSFASKLDLVFAHAWLPEEFESALRCVNSLRNGAAHALDYQLTEIEMKRLVDSMSGLLLAAWGAVSKPDDSLNTQLKKWFMAVLSVVEYGNLQNEYQVKNQSALSIYGIIKALEEKTGGTTPDSTLRERYGVPPQPLPGDVWTNQSESDD